MSREAEFAQQGMEGGVMPIDPEASSDRIGTEPESTEIGSVCRASCQMRDLWI